LLVAILSLYFTVVCGATLYGLSQTVQLITIDPKTAKSTPIGKPIPHELQAQSLASVDKTKGLYYFIGYDVTKQASELTGVSLKTGEIAYNYPLPFVGTGFVGVGQYVAVDPKSGQVIVIGLVTATVHTMLRVDVVAGTHKVLSNFTDGNLLGAFASYDGTNDIVWIDTVPVGANSLHIQGYDGQTGKLVQDLDDAPIIESLSWDSKTGLSYGVGLRVINSTTFERTLVSLDGKTGDFKEITVLKGFEIISSSISAFDPVGRILYSFLSKYGDLNVFYLVAVNVDNGNVVSAPQACAQDAACPWSLEYV